MQLLLLSLQEGFTGMASNWDLGHSHAHRLSNVVPDLKILFCKCVKACGCASKEADTSH